MSDPSPPQVSDAPVDLPLSSCRHHRASSADLTLASTLARCGGAGNFVSDDALRAVTRYAREARARGAQPNQIAAGVRRSFADAAPAPMTVVTFETIAVALVRHAMRALLDD